MSEGVAAGGAGGAAPTPATTPVAAPTPSRAEGVVLLGEMAGSGYREPPALARRSDGQTVQLTPLLHATLAALDGRSSYDELAAEVAARTGRPVNGDNVRELVEKLAPLGLVASPDGSQPELPRSNPLLGLRLKVAVSDPDRTNRITAPFAALFSLFVLVPVLAVFAWTCWWVLVERGLAAATHQAFERPGLLLLVFGVTVLSAGFHELGHAAAARRGGATPGVMGAGLYLIWPAFYTDVTDSYRLGRGGRLRVDLGGLYFNAIVAVATLALWWPTRWDALLLLVATQLLQMLRQLLPLVRFDGYHVLADLTGVPDLFQRIGPTLAALVPWKPTPPAARALKPWARAVVTAWVLTVVPVLLAVLVLMIWTLPRIVGTAWAGAGQQQDLMAAAYADGDLLATMGRALAMVVVALPVAAIAYLLVRLARQVGGAVWRRTDGRPLRRTLAVVTALAVVAGLVVAWWPTPERYRPVQAWEGGTLPQALSLARPPTGTAVGSRGTGTVMWPDGTPLPTQERPQLALVLVPADGAGTATTSPADRAAEAGDDADAGATPDGEVPEEGEVATAADDTWIFPFDEPLPPDEEDNQALAVNTTDGTASYAVAFALVWADGTEVADQTNEAFAAASCTGCAAVAVAFQVVLAVGDNDTAVPVNTAVAASYECTSCVTFALAVQLFVTLDEMPSAQAREEIEAVWADALELGAGVPDMPLGDLQAELSSFEEQILAILEEDLGPLGPQDEQDASGSPSPSDGSSSGSADPSPTDPSSSPTPSGSSGSSGSTSPSGSPTPSGSTSSSPSGSSSSPSSSPSTSSSPTRSASPTTRPSTSPTRSPSASPSTSPTTRSTSRPPSPTASGTP